MNTFMQIEQLQKQLSISQGTLILLAREAAQDSTVLHLGDLHSHEARELLAILERISNRLESKNMGRATSAAIIIPSMGETAAAA